MSDKKLKTLCYIMIAVTVILAIAAEMLLPEEIVIQVDFKGNPSTIVNKTLGIGVPMALGILGFGIPLVSDKPNRKYLGIGAAALLVMVITLIMNLKG